MRASFRPKSNSGILLDAALEAAREAGATAEVVDITRVRLAPCRACDACASDGVCVQKDDLARILDAVWRAERLLIATPVHYMAAPAQLKLFIDRTQCCYNRKYVLRRSLPADVRARRRGGVIAVCGSKVQAAFDGLDFTMKYLFDALEMDFAERLYVRRVDRPGEIAEHPERIEEARALGRRLAEG